NLCRPARARNLLRRRCRASFFAALYSLGRFMDFVGFDFKIFSFHFPAESFLWNCRPGRDEEPSGKSPPSDSESVSEAELGKSLAFWSVRPLSVRCRPTDLLSALVFRNETHREYVSPIRVPET